MRDEYVYREHQVGWVLVLLLLGGMLYNMAGRDALRVTRRDGRRFRIGSADVAGLVRVLEPRLQR